MEKYTLPKSSYLAYEAEIIETKHLTKEEKYYKLVLTNGNYFEFEPGQFVMVTIPGVGEAPISISSSPTQVEYFELVVRQVGTFTTAMHNLKAGDKIGIRGPYGTGFPVQILEGNDLLFVAGGIGIVPLRSLINYVLDNRRDFGKVDILLGCRNPESMLFSDEIDIWQERLDLNFNCTVDKGAPDWKGNVGLITSLIPGVDINPDKTFGVVVGPPIMYKFVIKELLDKKIAEDKIYLSFERRMKCGVGFCGHCQLGGSYCCKDGPVFEYKKIKNNIEAL